jgi:MYXO-CTERM domain-containing protein
MSFDFQMGPNQYGFQNPASYDVAHFSTPMPTALPMFATGLAGLGWLARRRRKRAA